MTLDDLDTSLDRAPVKEPSKRWKTTWSWKCHFGLLCRECAYVQWIKPGDLYIHCCKDHPSKEIADEKAYQWLEYNKDTWSYEGAIPV